MADTTAIGPRAADGMGEVERLLVQGDLSRLSTEQRMTYYRRVCESLGLNPLTQPLEYVLLQGKLRLYARKDCTEQLRKLHRVSVEIVSRQVDGECLTVHARASMPDGRRDEDYGVVALGKLSGEARANAVMKAVTKAKRRVTLSICGLGFLDETEVEDVAGAQVAPPVASPAEAPQLPPARAAQDGTLRERVARAEEEGVARGWCDVGDLFNHLEVKLGDLWEQEAVEDVGHEVKAFLAARKQGAANRG